jgi:hypothetical protein
VSTRTARSCLACGSRRWSRTTTARSASRRASWTAR